MNATTVPTGTAVVDGLRIRYADSGTDGPVILLTSPWPESLLAFRRVWPALAPTARLVAIDLPGFGHSEGRADVFSPNAMGEFLVRFIAAPGIEVFEDQDIRATIGASVEPVAPRAQEPDVWEDYVSAYENGRFAQSTRYVRSYPEQLRLLRDVLPEVRVPVRIFGATDDPLVPVSNARYLAERVPGSELTILTAGHFAWEEVPGEFASLVADQVTRAA
jgi:pimeloyl-ACP methyl ester carboxylesterase